MSDERAEVQLGARGQEEVIRAAEEIRGAYAKSAEGISHAFHSVGGKVRQSLSNAFEHIGDQIKDVASDAVRLSAAMGQFNLDDAIQSAERYNESIARIG